MSYFSNISFADPATDAFQRLRTASPYTIIDLKQLRDTQPLFYDDQQVSGSGTTSTYNAGQASTTIAVSNLTAGRRVRQSKLRGVYQPGKSMLVVFTAVVGVGANGITKRLGYFDAANGLFFQQVGSTMSVVRRSTSSGSPVDTVVTQANWNLDKMDGTGRSGITLDVTKTQIFAIDFEWLGVGRVRFAVNIDGKFYYVHEMLHANNLDVVYMGNPNLPIRYEIENSGSGPAASLVMICASVVSEGGQEDVAKSVYVSRGGNPRTLANQDLYTPIISVRLKAGAEMVKINPIGADILLTSNINYEWRLYLNPTIAGTDTASWVGVDNSGLEYDISRTATNLVSGGFVLAGGYGASTAQSRSAALGTVKSFLTLGTFINGASDELVLAVANIESNGGTAYGGIAFGEYT